MILTSQLFPEDIRSVSGTDSMLAQQLLFLNGEKSDFKPSSQFMERIDLYAKKGCYMVHELCALAYLMDGQEAKALALYSDIARYGQEEKGKKALALAYLGKKDEAISLLEKAISMEMIMLSEDSSEIPYLPFLLEIVKRT
jgi:hypothetical protein